jgi:hypothetical protein
MEDLVSMMVSNENPSEISDRLKEILHLKAAEKIESIRPYVSASMFGDSSYEDEE